MDYPTKSELKKIREWDCNDGYKELMEFVKSIWEYADCGFWSKRGNKYKISTGGWSGNEDIIDALSKNSIFWMACWLESKRGGHYIFEIPKALFISRSPVVKKTKSNA